MSVGIRRLVAGVAVCGLAVWAPASVASASGAVHDPSSGSVHNQTETIVDSVPCAGDFIIDLTYNATVHDVENKNGDWSTFTQTGDFDAATPVTITARDADGNATAWVPRTGPTFTGHFTIWGGFNLNREGQPQENANSTFTFSGHGTGSDGSTVAWHDVSHFNMSAGDILRVAFDKFACH
jgi:hypothetical protein